MITDQTITVPNAKTKNKKLLNVNLKNKIIKRIKLTDSQCSNGLHVWFVFLRMRQSPLQVECKPQQRRINEILSQNFQKRQQFAHPNVCLNDH